MTLWVYAFTDEPAGLPVEVVRAGGLAAAVARRLAPGPLSAEALWDHEHVVESLMDGRALLPARYGTTATEGELRVMLEARAGELRERLDHVRGRVEVAVRVLGRPEPAASGRDYLLARAEGTRRADLLHARLSELAVDAVRRPTRRGELLRAAYLVEQPEAEAFRRHAGEVPGGICTGPWPPYSFTGP